MNLGGLSPRDAGLLAWMPLSARRIWQVGGGAALGRAYLARNPQAEYLHLPGVDADLPHAAPDLIVCCEEPGLRRLAAALGPGGALILATGNPGYWRLCPSASEQARADALRAGLAQRADWARAMSDAGLRLQKLRFLADPRAEAEVLRDWDSGDLPEPQARRIWSAEALILCAVPAAQARPLLRVHHALRVPRFMAPRTEVPGRALAAEASILFSASSDGAIPADLPPGAPKVLVLQRARFPDPQEAVATIAGLMAAGWLVVTEFDDDPELVARVLRVPAEQFTMQFQAAHAVQTSTPALQERMRTWTAEAGLLPNTMAALPDLAPRVPGPTRVFYGALNRGDFAVRVAASLAPALARHPGTGFLVAHDRAFFEALPTPNKRFLGTLSYRDYLHALADADISLAPLEGRAGELGKSDLKYIEAASVATLTIASPAVYAGTLRHGETGLIAADLPDWPLRVAEALDDPVRARAMAMAARAQVAASRLIAHHVAGVRDWYFELWARREALTRAAVARVPALTGALRRAQAARRQGAGIALAQQPEIRK